MYSCFGIFFTSRPSGLDTNHRPLEDEKRRAAQISISLELPGLYYKPIDQPSAQNAFDKRCKVMEQFLDNETLKESILTHGNLGHLVSETALQHKVSKSYVYKLWSILCAFGLTKTSLRTRWDK